MENNSKNVHRLTNPGEFKKLNILQENSRTALDQRKNDSLEDQEVK